MVENTRSAAFMSLDEESILHTYNRNGLVVERGEGAVCFSPEGQEYIDFTAGIGVNSLGFCDPQWVQAVCEQAGRMQHISNLYYTEPQIRLAKLLTERTRMNKVFFCSSGAEANETAIKAARKYGNGRSDNMRNEIITLQDSFHGRTMAAITATGQDAFHDDFHPFVPGFTYCPANDISALENLMSEKTCAVMLELVQGEGGVNDLQKDFVKAAAEFCREKDALLIADEVQTGIGRAGTLFAYEQYEIEPDMVTFAKGIGGGLPIGGVLFNERAAGILTAGNHGTTYGGNPVACAGAIEVLGRIDDDFLKQVQEKGSYLQEKIAEFPDVEEITGRGLMLGIKTGKKAAKDVVGQCLEKGLLVLTAKDKVRLLPPLTITMEELDRGLGILAEVLS